MISVPTNVTPQLVEEVIREISEELMGYIRKERRPDWTGPMYFAAIKNYLSQQYPNMNWRILVYVGERREVSVDLTGSRLRD
jgi:hypothetical protein